MFVWPSRVAPRKGALKGTYYPSGALSSVSQHHLGDDNEWSDLSRRLGRRGHVYSLVPRTSLMTPRIMTEQPTDRSTNTDLALPGPRYLHWSPILAGAILAAAVSFVLLSFGSGIGLAVASPSSTWRDTSAALALVGGLWLLLTSLASFGSEDTWPVGCESLGATRRPTRSNFAMESTAFWSGVSRSSSEPSSRSPPREWLPDEPT